MSRFENVEFVKADCLQIDSYPDLSEVNAIVHSVGSITDLVNYKQMLRSGPLAFFNDPAKAFQEVTSTGSYEQSLEAQNRDSVKLIAEQYHRQRKGGLFVFISAEASIVPLKPFQRYADTKREAEDFLKDFCTDLNVVIVRPGLVYN